MTSADVRRRAEGRPSFRKLQSGPGLKHEEVQKNQRGRLIAAMVDLCSAAGYGRVTVKDLTRTAGVSKATYYELFRNKEECLLSTYDDVLRTLAYEILAVERDITDERQRLEAALDVLGTLIATHPGAARLALIEAPAAGATALSHVRKRIGLLEKLAADRLCSWHGESLLPVVVRGIVAGIAHVAQACVLSGRPQKFSSHVDELLDWTLGFRPGVVPNGPARQAALRGMGTRRPARDPEMSEKLIPGDRQLLLAATLRLAMQGGYVGLSESRICVEAGLPRRAFEANFVDVPDCFLTALDFRMESISRLVDSGRVGDPWQMRVGRVITAGFDEFARDSRLARVFFIDVFEVGPDAVRWREAQISALADCLRRLVPEPIRPGRVASEASVAAIVSVVQSRLADDRPELLTSDLELCIYLALASTGARPISTPIH